MTTKEQNERLWRAIDFYFGWLQESEDAEYEVQNFQAATSYSNCSMQFFDLLKEEELYDLMFVKGDSDCIG